MNAHNRTLLTVICEAALEHKLEADLKTLGAPGWTLSDARGSGSRGYAAPAGTPMATSAWK